METDMQKFAILAERSAASPLGAATAWLKSNGAVILFDAMDEARAAADAMNCRCTSGNVHYAAAVYRDRVEHAADRRARDTAPRSK
jgi:hypothetical protein